MLINDAGGVGRIQVKTLALPDFARRVSGTYTYSGKVLVDYHRDDDPEIKDYIHIAVMNDDGTGFKDIFSGVVPVHKKANGVRYMPFKDNKRVLLGDYILECAPDIDHCEKTELIPLAYPWGLQEDERVFMSWSEVIISPDNEYVCWTTLTSGIRGAVNGIGKLIKEDGRYVISNAQIISGHDAYTPDPERPGYVKPKPMRGGEVKQFVRGGTAISLVGGSASALADSVLQDLLSEDILQITHVPGYEETTIFSPDEKLGLVMSTRGSPGTNCAILGLLPRPHAMLVTAPLIMTVYMYAVAGVRQFREGNVGPVLIEIDKSIEGKNYQGAVLNDPEGKWVYYSPMSWHPNGKKAMWPEVLRGAPNRRLRIAELPDYTPAESVPVQKTPENIPYGITDANELFPAAENNAVFKIAGKAGGCLEHTRKDGIFNSAFKQFSDDGKSFIDGYEKSGCSPSGDAFYEADLVITGEEPGAMKCRLVFSAVSFTEPPRLLKEKSYGCAEYGGVRLRVEDMAE